MINYYQELNINENLQGEELKKELKNLQRKWIGRTNAPDLNRRQDAKRKVQTIVEAEKILLDDIKRKEYDNQLQQNSNRNGQETQQETYNANSNNVEELIQTAWNLINESKRADAIMVARQATAIEVNNDKAWGTLAYAYCLWNNPKDAEDAYKRAINLKPNQDTYYCELGNLYLDYNEFAKAKDCAEKANAINPNSSYNKILLANVYTSTNDYDSAIAIIEELIEKEPNNEGHKKMIANCYYSKGISYCYADNNGYIYNVTKDDTEKMIENMEKAQRYVNDSGVDEKISWGKKALSKKFDKDKISLFSVPVIAFLLFDSLILAIILAAGIGYLCMRPQWRLTRNELFEEKTAFDYSSLIVTKTIGLAFGAFLVLCKVGLEVGLAAVGVRRRD